MDKKCKVVMLPTKEKAESYLYLYKKQLFLNIRQTVAHYKDTIPQHLYVLSDDEIKKDDYVYADGVIYKIVETSKHSASQGTFSKEFATVNRWKKVIATTDPSLKEWCIGEYKSGQDNIIKNIPSPSQSFIQKYVEEYNKGNVITEVMVEYEDEHVFDDDGTKLGNAVDEKTGMNKSKLKVNPKDNTITIRKIKDSWTRKEHVEDLIKLLNDATYSNYSEMNLKEKAKFLDNWINKNL